MPRDQAVKTVYIQSELCGEIADQYAGKEFVNVDRQGTKQSRQRAQRQRIHIADLQRRSETYSNADIEQSY